MKRGSKAGKVNRQWGKNRMLVVNAVEGFDYKALFEEDILAVQEFNATKARNRHLEPEKQLMLAVLDDAVYCFQKYINSSTRAGRKFFCDADEWFLAKDDDGLFSFKSVCSYLGLEADYVRKGLECWREKAQKPAGEIQLKVRKRERTPRLQTSKEELNAATA